MSLVPSLLQAIVSLDGEACVIHVGDVPYVVAPSGQVDLATRGLTYEAVNGILEQLLPVESLNALDEFGAIQYELPARAEFQREGFTVVAARGGEDVWVEIRRKRAPDEDRVPMDVFATAEPIAAHDPESMRQANSETLSMPESADLWPDDGETPVEVPLYDDTLDVPASAEPASAEEIHLPASVEIDQPPRPSLYAVPRFERETVPFEHDAAASRAVRAAARRECAASDCRRVHAAAGAVHAATGRAVRAAARRKCSASGRRHVRAAAGGARAAAPATYYSRRPCRHAAARAVHAAAGAAPPPPPVQYTPPPVQYAPPPVQSAPPPVQSAPPPVQSAPPPVQYTPPPAPVRAAARAVRAAAAGCSRRPSGSAPNPCSRPSSCRSRATRPEAMRRRC